MNKGHSSDAKFLLNDKVTYYPDFIRVWLPNVPQLVQKEGYESKKKQGSVPKEQNKDVYETNEERSIRRTRKTIKDYVLCNDFDIFATFTIADDRFNDDRSRKRFATWLKNQRNRNGKFRYIVVAERHKNGALHFHVLIGEYKGKLVLGINPHNGEYIPDGYGGYVHNFAEFTLGYSTAKLITTKESKTKTAYYLQKYINKDMVMIFGKNRYWASKGLVKPKTENNPEPFYKGTVPDRHWVIDHGTVLEFDRNKHSDIDEYLKAHQL